MKIKRGEVNEIVIVSPEIPVTLAMDGKAILINIADIKASLRRIALAAIMTTFSDATEDKANETVDALVETVLDTNEIGDITSDAYAQLFFGDVLSLAMTERIRDIEAAKEAGRN